LDYTIADTADWLACQPGSGSAAAGETDTIAVSFDTAALPLGQYHATITVSAADAEPQGVYVALAVAIKGDVNTDGTIDIADVSRCLQMAVGAVTPDLDLADLDGNGTIDSQDAALLLEWALDGKLFLKHGWNLIGATAAWRRPANAKLLSTVWWWNADRQEYEALADGQRLVPGRSYWLYAVEDCDVTLEPYAGTQAARGLTKGDLSGDGVVDATDVILCLQMVAGTTAPDVALADMDGDGTVDNQDAILLLQSVVKGKLDLKHGWNLVGATAAWRRPTLAQVQNPIWGWDAERQVYKVLAQGAKMTPGHGYWIAVTADCQPALEP